MALAVFFIPFLSVCFGASEPQFSASLDRAEASRDDIVRLKIQITAEADSISIQGPDFEAPDFDIVNQFSGSYQNGTITAKGFQWTTRREFTFFLKAKREGDLEIRNIRASIEGQTKRADNLLIRVGSSKGGSVQKPPALSVPSVSRSTTQSEAPAQEEGDARREIFVRPELSQESLYKGQMATLSYYLYSRVRVIESLISKFPNLNGFFREEMDLPSQRGASEVTLKVIGGETYEKRLLTRYSVYALRDGVLEVDPMSVKVQYQRGKRPDEDGFSDPFLNFFRQLTPAVSEFSSDPVKVTIAALPSAGRPSNFSGAVGDFQVLSAVDRYEIDPDESAKLTITIEGDGNVSAFEEPSLELPDGIELFNATSKKAQIGTETRQRIFVLEFLPKKSGTFQIPSAQWSFFNPKEKRYVTRSIEGFELKVRDGLGKPRETNVPESKLSSTEGIPETESDLPPFQWSPWFTALEAFFSRLGNLLLWVFGSGAVFFMFAYEPLVRLVQDGRRKRERRVDPSRKILAELQQEFGLAARHPHREEVARLWKRLDEGVKRLIEAKVRGPVGAYSEAELEQALKEIGRLNEVQWQSLQRVLQRLANARYSGQAPHEDAWFETWLEVQRIFR